MTDKKFIMLAEKLHEMCLFNPITVSVHYKIKEGICTHTISAIVLEPHDTNNEGYFYIKKDKCIEHNSYDLSSDAVKIPKTNTYVTCCKFIETYIKYMYIHKIK